MNGYRYQSPPNWPAPPEDWAPPEGWRPPSGWPPAPEGWQFWALAEAPEVEPRRDRTALRTQAVESPKRSEPPESKGADIPMFGARKRARELAASAEALRAENEHLRAELARTGALDAATIELERTAAQRRFESERDQHAQVLGGLAREQREARNAVDVARAEVVVLEEMALLQEVGIYEYHHPLENAEAYKARLTDLRRRIKEMAKRDGGAIEAASGWTVNGSVSQGKRMVAQTSKLMLRAFNAEVDTVVRALKPHRLTASIERLRKTAKTIERLGTMMSIRVSPYYLDLRIDELRLTADYLAKVEEEKEANRAAREALREQRKVEREMAQAKEKLEKERRHVENALAALRAKGDDDGVARLETQLADVGRAIEDVDYRAANQRAGYVYVISNIGALGEQVIKIGLTRRLEPMDRVRELGDASVPFGFDVHALFFSDDAVGIEAEMHRRFAERRVNQVNLRREFFYATPVEALEQLRDLTGEVLEFTEIPEALEYRQSRGQMPEVEPGAEVRAV